MKGNRKLLIGIVLIAATAVVVALNGWTRGHVVEAFKQLAQAGHDESGRPDKSWIRPVSTGAEVQWDRTLTLGEEQVRAIGLKTFEVKPQTDYTVLKLFGTTDYDPATVTVVRTQFDSRVEKVLVDYGSIVKTGDPLLELFSTELAEAKSNYEVAISQWVHDKEVLDYKTPLIRDKNLPGKEAIEVKNDEAQSRLKMKLAKDKLLVYGLTAEEIENAKKEDGVQKAKMILRSRAEGVVVLRSVVPGNYYTSADLLMTIAPLDHLWVKGSVSELDAEKVKVGQRLKVIFPFSDRTIDGAVNYIDKAIDAESRSAKFRTTIRNPGGELKAGMFVRMTVDIPPVAGRTVIPRVAMVSVDRFDYVFVRKAGKPDQFERRQIFVAKESNDVVIVDAPSKEQPGLKAGEEVATTGSLILEQMFEDRVMTEGTFLFSRTEEGHPDPMDNSNAVISSTPSAKQ
jgi:cobalt-zinc-cadmium efflux system membrane fusion protein